MKLCGIKMRQEKQLVPLIPNSGQHVRPSRIRPYVLLLVAALCLLVAVFFFLFPRPIDVSNIEVKSVSVSYDDDRRIVYLNISSSLNVTNENFYPIYLTTVMVQVQCAGKVIGKAKIDLSMTTGPRAERQVEYTVPTALADDMSYMYDYCTLQTIKVHKVGVIMQVGVTIVYFHHTEQHLQETYQDVDCGGNTTALLAHPHI